MEGAAGVIPCFPRVRSHLLNPETRAGIGKFRVFMLSSRNRRLEMGTGFPRKRLYSFRLRLAGCIPKRVRGKGVVMGRILRLVIGVMMVLTLGACVLSDSFGDVDREPMSDFEINRYRYEFYTKMVPAQRDYYEGLPNRVVRDAYLRQLGLMKGRSRKRR